MEGSGVGSAECCMLIAWRVSCVVGGCNLMVLVGV